MTKAELIDMVAEKVDGPTKAQVAEVYDAVFETIVRALKEDPSHRFNVSGFGTFQISDRKAREGINPRTKEKIQIAASKAVTFKQASALKAAVSK